MTGFWITWFICGVACIIPWGFWYGTSGIIIQSAGLLGMILLLLSQV